MASRNQPARRLDPRLTHRIVSADGYWGKGVNLVEARKAYRAAAGKPPRADAVVWAVTAETTINEMGRFTIPGEFVQPADVT